MTTYKQRKDGEGFEVQNGELYRIACCDCGLVHDFVFVAEGDQIGVAAKRNNRATAQRRRHMKAQAGPAKASDDGIGGAE